MCRRQQTDEIREVLEALHDRDPDIPLHGFGVKSLGLRRYGDLLTSADRRRRFQSSVHIGTKFPWR
jgi:hypothetical protein